MAKKTKQEVVLDRKFLNNIVRKLKKSNAKFYGLLTELKLRATKQEVHEMHDIEAAQWYCIDQLKLKLKEQHRKII